MPIQGIELISLKRGDYTAARRESVGGAFALALSELVDVAPRPGMPWPQSIGDVLEITNCVNAWMYRGRRLQVVTGGNNERLLA